MRQITLYWRLPLGQFWQCIIKKKGFRKEKGSFKKFLRLQNQHSNNIIIIGGKYFVLQFEFFYWILLCKCILKILKITIYHFGVLFEKIVSWFASTYVKIYDIDIRIQILIQQSSKHTEYFGIEFLLDTLQK